MSQIHLQFHLVRRLGQFLWKAWLAGANPGFFVCWEMAGRRAEAVGEDYRKTEDVEKEREVYSL